jgi:hypothetical protein
MAEVRFELQLSAGATALIEGLQSDNSTGPRKRASRQCLIS